MSRWTWSKTKEQALRLIFEGRQTRDQIALSCAVPARTLDYWIAHQDFQTRLQQLYADIEAATRGMPYITKTQRLAGLSSMAEQARVEFETRPWLKEVRPTPDGDITNESFNRDAHAAFRGALDDIAKELGQRTNKVDVTTKLQGSVTHDLNLALDADAAAAADTFIRSLTHRRTGESSGPGVSGE